MPESEIDRIDPEGKVVALKSGMEVEVVRLRTRQLFRLLKVLTHGAGQMFMQMAMDFNADPGAFSQKLLMVVLISIPDAEQEAIDFVQSMCRPVGLHEGPVTNLTDPQREGNQSLWARQGRELFNPDIEDLLTVFEAVIRQESGDIQGLGKRVAGMLTMATGLSKTETPAAPLTPQQMTEATASPDSMPAPSTRSAASTAGQTDGS